MLRIQNSLVVAITLAFAATAACGTEAKKDIAKSAIDTMPDDQRRQTFEATARMLDENPELVDELYAIVRTHKPTMQRFIWNAAGDLREPWLADSAAKAIAEHPEAIEQVLVSSIDAISESPQARKAMTRGMTKRADKAVDILTDDRSSLAQLTEASIRVLRQKPQARANVLAATKLVLRESMKDESALGQVLKAIGAIDEEPTRSKAKR